MEIIVETVSPKDPDRVKFTCAHGSAWARWRGEQAPEQGIWEVELEFPGDMLRWNKAARSGSEIRQEGDLRVLGGLVERIAEDGVLELRFGSDIILLDAVPQIEGLSVGMNVEFWFDELELYPYMI